MKLLFLRLNTMAFEAELIGNTGATNILGEEIPEQ